MNYIKQLEFGKTRENVNEAEAVDPNKFMIIDFFILDLIYDNRSIL